MSEEKKLEYLNKLIEVLDDVPEEHHEEVAQILTHDANVMARTIAVIGKKGGSNGQS